MSEKGHYLRSDGNGGYIVKKDTLYIILGLITLVSFLVGIGIAYASVVSDVSYLKEQYKEAGPNHTEIINKLDDRIKATEENEKVLNTKIDYISSDVTEMKGDIKTLLQK